MGQQTPEPDPKYTTNALLTLIGAIIIRLTNGIVLIWGSTNLYFLSYLHYEGHVVSNSTNSQLLLASTIPIALLTLTSVKLANKFGYQFVMRLCGFVFLFSPLLINYFKGMAPFVIFYMVLPGAAFAMSTIPLLNILITQFPKYRARVNSMLIVCLGISTFATNCIFSVLVNPHNVKSQLINGFQCFPKDVASNVLRVNNIITLVSGSAFVVGSLLLKQKKQKDQKIRNVLSLESDDLPTQKLTMNKEISKESAQEQSLCQSVFSSMFICCFMIAIFNGLFPNYVSSYFKIVFMPIVNNDYILTCLSAAYSLATILGALGWGWLADKYGVASSLLILVSIDVVLKMMSFGLQNPIVLYIFYPLSGLLDKGTLTMISPGLIELFGIQRGTELLPIRQLSTVLSFSILPLGQLLTKNLLNFYQLMQVLAIINISTLVPAIILYLTTRKVKTDSY